MGNFPPSGDTGFLPHPGKDGSGPYTAAPLRVLLVEDSARDEELLRWNLREAGYQLDLLRVQNATELKSAFSKQHWDVVIADYQLPKFSAPEALEILKEHRLDIPFLILSGTIGEERASELMRAGARDCLSKDNLQRLAPALDRELREAEVRRRNRRFEAELKFSEERYRLLFNGANDAVFLHLLSVEGMPGNFLEVNDLACERLGYTREELLGLTPMQLEHPNHPNLISRIIPELLTKKRKVFETALLSKEGRALPVEISAQLLTMRGTLMVLSVARDTADRKRAEEQLQVMSRAVDQSPLGIVITDPKGVIRYANTHSQQSAAFEPDHMIGRSFWELQANRMAPEAFRHFLDTIHAGLKWEGEFRLPGKGASGFWGFSSVSPIFDNEGKITHFLAVQEDITKRKAAEQSMLELMGQRDRLLNRLQLILAQMPIGCILTDPQGRITYWSPAAEKIFGNSAEDTLGSLLWETVPTIDAAQDFRALCSQMEQEKAPLQRTLENRTKDGRSILCAWHATPILDAQSGLTGYMAMVQDVSENRLLEERLRQSQKMEAVGQLAGGVAHDFNNILAAVLMNLSLMQMTADLPPDLVERLEELEREVTRATSLTRQLLLFSRRQVAQFQALDLQEILRNLLKMLRRLIGENIELTFTGSASPLWVNADSGMLDQVLMNLCINARDAMPNGGRLIIGTRLIEVTPALAALNPEARTGLFACLSVSDTGCGIEPGTLKRVFEPFFTTKDVGKGTGLGLATVYGIVKQHNGWLEVDSTPGEGSCFKVYFPVLPRVETAAHATRNLDLPRGGRETILIVEDEDSVRRMGSLYLKRLGYNVIEACNGQEALKLWHSSAQPIHLLFSDVVMPEGLSGLELADTLRQKDPSLKVILSSGYSTDLLKAGGNLPATAYLPKPYEAGVLAKLIRSVLENPEAVASHCQ